MYLFVDFEQLGSESQRLLLLGYEMEVFDPMVKTYEKTAELMHWENKGHIVVPSVYEAGAVQNTPAIPGMEKIGRYF